MESQKFGFWDFGAQNHERVHCWAKTFIKSVSDPTNPWQILHGIDAKSYEKPLVIVSSDEAQDKPVENGEEPKPEENHVFLVPEPPEPIAEKKNISIDICLKAPAKQWPQLLPDLTEDDACVLIQEFCEKSSVVLERHALVAKHLLLPRLQSGDAISRKFAFAAMKFVTSFPAQSVRFLLTDLIVRAPANERHLNDIRDLVNQLLKTPMRSTLLSSVASSMERLHKCHIQFLLLLVGGEEAAETADRLVTLLADAPDELQDDVSMGRLVIAVVRLAPADRSALAYIVGNHRTPLKNKAAKLLRELPVREVAAAAQ